MTRARILNKGLLSCFPAGLCGEEGDPIHAEVSAAAFDGKRLLLGSDKSVPGDGRSAVFTVEYSHGDLLPDSLEYLTAPLIKAAKKFEDFSFTAQGDHVLASTGFDRIDPDSVNQHNHNNLLIWPHQRPEEVRVVAARDEQGVRSSVALRSDLGQALDADYFKVEGLAAIPSENGEDDELLFGIRELGQNHEKFDYVNRVVGAPYRVNDGQLEFTGAFKVVHDFQPGEHAEVRFPVGLSSLEYDRYGQRMFWLTSFETEDADGVQQIGAYLWAQSLQDFYARKPPQAVCGESGRALEFVNKAEGLAVLDAEHLFVVYDNDRHVGLEAEQLRSRREPHEAPYAVLQLQ